MDNQLADIVKRLATLHRSDIKNWLKKGELLTEAQAIIGTADGFAAWCKQINTPKRTAQKAMAAFRDFGEAPRTAQFSIEAMRILGGSAAAREDAIDLAKHQKITARIAKDILRDYVTETISMERPTKRRTHTETLEVPGGFIVITTTESVTDGDLLGLLAYAARELKARASVAA